MALKKVNAVVIGAGAGGGIVAKELAGAGLSVVLLERGKWYSAADCRKDDLRNQRTTVLGNGFGPDDERNPRVLVDEKGRAHSAGQRTRLQQQRRMRGRRHPELRRAWPGATWRRTSACAPPTAPWRAARSKTGRSRYEDLEPYYEKAEWEIGVSGDDSNNLFKAPRRKPLPMPPLPPNREHQLLLPAAKKLGYHPFDIPMLRNTVPYNGRAGVHAMPLVRGVRLRSERQVRHAEHRDSHRARHGQLRAAHRLHGEGDSDRLPRARHRRRVLRRRRPPARAAGRHRGGFGSRGGVRAAAAQLEEPGCSRTGSGTATTGWAATCKATPIRAQWGCFRFDTYDDVGPGAGIAVCDFNHGNPGPDRRRHAGQRVHPPAVSIRRTTCRPESRAGAKRTRNSCASGTSAAWPCMGPVQEMPMFDSRVQVDPKVKDYWGIPVARMSGGKHPHTHRDCGVYGEEGRGVAEGSRRRGDLDRSAGAELERRPAPGRHLPHGQRSEDLGGEPPTASCTTSTTSS